MARAPQLIGIPYDASSSFLRGSAAAPPLVREALWSPAGNTFTETGVDIKGLADAGDLKLSENPAMAREQIEAGINKVLDNGFRPISIGGDHSIAYPILRAIARKHKMLTIVQIDAHGDLYDEFEGDRYSHACPFARIMEERLALNLIQVGVRTLTTHQREQAKRFAVEVIEMRRFAEGMRPTSGNAVYLSVDLDALDPAFAPGVSHREPGGLTVRDVVSMVQHLNGDIVGADVVELNPAKDVDGITAAVAAKIVKEIAGRMIGHR